MTQLIVMLEKQVIKRLTIRGTSVTFGRNNKCDITLPDRTISNQHANITVVRDDCFLEDLHSTNGTYVNYQRIDRYLLEDGDIINLGKYHIEFQSNLSVDQQARRMSLHPRLMDKGITHWLEILNGKRSGYIIPLRQTRIVLGSRQTGQIVIEPEHAGGYSMQEKGISNTRMKRILTLGDKLRVEDIAFLYCIQEPNVNRSNSPEPSDITA